MSTIAGSSREHVMSEHGLRDMIMPEMEGALPADGETGERRHAHCHERTFEGVLMTEEGDHPILCLDVAFGGVRVCATDGFLPELGELVEIEISQGDNSFRDDCLVVETSQGPDGTIIHLAM